jgi:hypothetical protein
VFAFGVLEIVIRELGPFLFQLALGDVPVAFDFQCGHDDLALFYFLFVFIRRQRDGNDDEQETDGIANINSTGKKRCG